ncbi:hypothetical protein KGM_213577 [Danaus plexippus plexippus]|uniref:Uncharacterized protein n=1 Tax=Danaus plexippus plexippus TaxID=278856 RepID=A0A212FIN6_DANPL|nr:uncharacterized protein LOC116772550 isoform X2 [Danaus plexippus plexippus]OWR53604.1 hypothetical protein KGM_213577 [Danaus plexippus plexippus]
MLFTRKVINLSILKTLKLQSRKCHSLFGIKDILQQQEQPDVFSIHLVKKQDHEMAVELIKTHYLTEHVLVRTRKMDLSNDNALDEYLVSLMKQGNTIFAKTEDGRVAGICVNFATSPVDCQNLRNYAFYRQDPNTKDFLYFNAKLQETPNLWNIYKQPKVFEIKMLAVLPEFRRQGLGTRLAEKSMSQAQDQGYNVIRMDCINPYDYKIAERLLLNCIVKYPLHKLRGANASFVKRSSEHNTCVRVYVNTRVQNESCYVNSKEDLENIFE